MTPHPTTAMRRFSGKFCLDGETGFLKKEELAAPRTMGQSSSFDRFQDSLYSRNRRHVDHNYVEIKRSLRRRKYTAAPVYGITFTDILLGARSNSFRRNGQYIANELRSFCRQFSTRQLVEYTIGTLIQEFHNPAARPAKTLEKSVVQLTYYDRSTFFECPRCSREHQSFSAFCIYFDDCRLHLMLSRKFVERLTRHCNRYFVSVWKVRVRASTVAMSILRPPQRYESRRFVSRRSRRTANTLVLSSRFAQCYCAIA